METKHEKVSKIKKINILIFNVTPFLFIYYGNTKATTGIRHHARQHIPS